MPLLSLRNSCSAYGILFIGITLLGTILRFHNLDNQSVWSDEYFVVGLVSPPSLDASWRLLRYFNADNALLFHLAVRVWYHIVGSDVFWLRVLPAMFGALTVPIVIHLSKDRFGVWPALTAGAFIALSPTHIWFSEALRPYSLFYLFAMISVLTLPDIVERTSRRKAVLHHASNFVMLLTHPFAAFLLAAQALYLAIMRIGRRGLVFWCALQFLFSLPTALLLWANRAYIGPKEIDHIVMYPVSQVLPNVLAAGDAFFELSTEHPRLLQSTPFGLSLSLWQSIESFAQTTILVLAVLAMIALAALTMAPRAPHKSNALLLLLCIALPPILMYVASFLWRPILEPRYILYNPSLLYVGIAWMTMRSNRRYLHFVAIMLLLALSIESLSLSRSGTRTDWLSAARHLEAYRQPGESVAVFGLPPFDRDTMLLHTKNPENIHGSLTIDSALHSALSPIANADSSDISAGWIVFELAAPTGNEFRDFLDAHLAETPIEVTYFEFSGRGTILVARLELPLAYSDDSSWQVIDPLDTMETAMKFGELTPTTEQLSDLIGVPYTSFPMFGCFLAMLLLESQHYHLAALVSQHTLDAHPSYGLAEITHSMTAAALGQPDIARRHLLRAKESKHILVPVYTPFLAALLVEQDEVAAKFEMESLDSIVFSSGALRAAYEGLVPDERRQEFNGESDTNTLRRLSPPDTHNPK